MPNKNKLNRYYLALIVLGAIARLLPHRPNFTPTGAIAFFSGSKFSGSAMSYLIPLLILFFSDIVLGWHSLVIPVYGCFLISVALGKWLNGSSLLNKSAGLLLSAVNFFIVTNFAVWLSSGMYPKTAAGLGACYIAALPFFYNDLAATFVYGATFFLAADFIEKRLQISEKAAATLA